MSLYSRDDERAIRVRRLVEDWTTSGLLSPEQRERVVPGLTVELRRTNRFLRITLFVFGILIVGSLTGLSAITLDFRATAAAVFLFAAAGAFFALAQWIVTRYRVYHFGIEEAAAVASVYLMAFGAAIVLESFSMLRLLIAATIGAFVVFRRFGFMYAGVAAVILAAMVPFGTDQVDTVRRLAAVVIMLTVFFVARERRQDHEWDYPADVFAAVEATAWAMMYLLVNLKASEWLSIPDEVPQFYWATYAAIWILPVAGLWLAVRDRHRLMLDLNIVLAIVTMMSNKPYLGGTPNSWDPILFGVMLIVVAVGLKRWLSSGPGESRRGFIARRLLASERDRLSLAGGAASLVHGAPAPAQAHEPPTFGGGASGGAGASGSF
jgi:hypothetical protein